MRLQRRNLRPRRYIPGSMSTDSKDWLRYFVATSATTSFGFGLHAMPPSHGVQVALPQKLGSVVLMKYPSSHWQMRTLFSSSCCAAPIACKHRRQAVSVRRGAKKVPANPYLPSPRCAQKLRLTGLGTNCSRSRPQGQFGARYSCRWKRSSAWVISVILFSW